MSLLHEPEICYSILENLPVGLCVVDMQKRIVLWSDGAERVTGHTRYEAIGHSRFADNLLHCDQTGCEFCSEESPLAKAIRTAQPAEGFGFLHHKKGHEIPVRIRAVPVRNAHGSIIGAVEIFEEQQAVSPEHRENSPEVAGAIDDITRVASHVMMQAHLRRTLDTFHEVQVPFGILCFRLEGLDQFRASFGLEAASSLLRVVARTLEGTLWKSDHVGRWADDQFLVILNDCRAEAMDSVRERVRRMLANDGITWWGERRSLPISIGPATPQSGDSVDSLMDRAQKSLDAASTGRARCAGAGSARGSSSSGSSADSFGSSSGST